MFDASCHNVTLSHWSFCHTFICPDVTLSNWVSICHTSQCDKMTMQHSRDLLSITNFLVNCITHQISVNFIDKILWIDLYICTNIKNKHIYSIDVSHNIQRLKIIWQNIPRKKLFKKRDEKTHTTVQQERNCIVSSKKYIV